MDLAMPTVFEKLNLKGQNPILVLNSPTSFEPELGALLGVMIVRDLDSEQPLPFCLVFVEQQAEIVALAPQIAARAQGDAVVWFAYPKGTSRRYTCDFNRDTGWGPLRAAGFETVRQIAIDEDWSALRFRRLEFIKTLKRATKRPAPSA